MIVSLWLGQALLMLGHRAFAQLLSGLVRPQFRILTISGFVILPFRGQRDGRKTAVVTRYAHCT